MESRLLGLKTSLSTRRTSLAMLGRSLESSTLIPFIHRYAMFFFFQLDRWDGTLEFHKGRGKIRPTLTAGTLLAWKNTFAIASTFALSMSSPITSFWLASSFRHMSVSLGQLLSRSVWVILPGGKLTQTLLLSNCPRLTDICLKELASQKEVIGLDMSRANVKAITKVFFQADSIPAVTIGLIFPLPLWNSRVPSHLSSWKKKDIA